MRRCAPLRVMPEVSSTASGRRRLRVVLENAALENRANPQPASVHLRILLDYGDATQLPPERRLTVIAISFAVFFGLVSFSAAKLWQAANPRA